MFMLRKRVFLALVVSLALLTALAGAACAEDAKSLCDKAKELYASGKITQAAELYTKAIEADPSFAAAYIGRGQCKRKLTPADLKGSLDDLDVAVSKDPKSAEAFNNRGITYYQLKDYAKARKDYDRAIELAPGVYKSYFNRGGVGIKEENYPGAIADYTKSLELHPDDPIAYLERGLAKKNLGQLDEALADYEKALKLDPKYADAINNRGNIKLIRRDFAAARADFAAALKLAPNSTLFKSNLEKAETAIANTADTKPTTTAASKNNTPVAEKRAETNTIVQIEYIADKPDDTATWNIPDTPWTKGETPITGAMPASELVSPETNFADLDFDAYRQAVMSAMECVRLIYGDMTPQEAGKFEAKWAPVLDCASPKGVEYFNKLNPLLARFVSIRSAIVQTTIQFDDAWTAAGISAGFGNNDDALDSLSRANAYKTNLADLKKQMDAVVEQISALGDPPNPMAARHRARKRFETALKSAVTIAINPGKQTVSKGKAAAFKPIVPGAPKKVKVVWSFGDGKTQAATSLASVSHAYAKEGAYAVKLTVTDVAKGKTYGAAEASVTVGAAVAQPGARYVLADWAVKVEPHRDVTANGNSISENMVFRDTDKSGKEIETGNVTFGYSWQHPPSTFRTTDNMNFTTEMAVKSQSGKWTTEIEGCDAILAFFKPEEKDLAVKLVSGQEIPAYTFFKLLATQFMCKPEWVPRHDLFNNEQAGKYLPSKQTWTAQFPNSHNGSKYPVAVVKVHIKSFNVDAQACYVYTYDPTGSRKPIELNKNLAQKNEESNKKTPEQIAAEEDKKAKDEEIAQHKKNIDFYIGSLQRWNDELRSEKNSDRRKELNQRLIDAHTEIQREKDLIASIQTGTIVHTRSMAEEVQHAQVVQSCFEDLRKCKEIQDNAIRAQRFTKAVESTRDLINLLSPEESSQMHEWANKHLGVDTFAKHDTAKLKQLTSAILHKVQGQSLANEASAQEAINTLEEIKFGASTALIVVAPFAAAEGLVAGSSIAAQSPSWIATGYGVGTGYIEGGVKGAVVTGARFYSTGIDVVMSAMEGFQAEEGGGFTGAAKNVALTLLMRKGGEIAAKNIVQGRVKAANSGRSWKDVVEDANFKQAKKDGEAVVRNYKDADEAFAKMVEKEKPKSMTFEEYVAANSEKLANTKEGKSLKDAIAMVENSYTAKVAFNEEGVPPALRERYNMTSETYLEKPVISKTQELMKAKGWNEFEMNQIRHSANKKKVGHDRDLAVKEEGWIPEKDGQAKSLTEFQADLEHCLKEAYSSVSGKRSAKLSDWKGTTSVDAEAYLDKAVLDINKMRQQGIDPLSKLDPTLAGQTAGVNVNKVNLALSKGTREGTAEACRTLSKELNTKIIPFMPKGTPAAKYFEKLKGILDKGVNDPRGAELEAYGFTGKRLPELSRAVAKRLMEIIQGGG